VEWIRAGRVRRWHSASALVVGLVIVVATPASAIGTGWKIEPGRPFNGTIRFLGISCPTTAFCAAVGQAGHNISTAKTYAESWNGKEWSIAPSSGPKGSSLFDVSCVDSDWCQAVGSSVGYGAPLTEHWNGRAWSKSASPSTRGTLQGVSCSTRTWCVAVGSQAGRGTESVTLVEQWNGTAWKVVPSPSRGGIASVLSRVSCVSPKFCMAVGHFDEGVSSSRTLIERWEGHGWAVIPSENPGPANQVVDLFSVDCVSSTWCIAGGRAESGALIERWNGNTWRLVAHPSAQTSYAILSGVARVSRNACVSVGSDQNGGIAEGWNGPGTKWFKIALPPYTVRKPYALWALSCAAATLCKATGPGNIVETSS
jgi:hypothetical protein